MKIRSDFVSNSSSSSFILGAKGSLVAFISSQTQYSDEVAESLIIQVMSTPLLTAEEAIEKYTNFIENDYWVEEEVMKIKFGEYYEYNIPWRERDDFMWGSGKDEFNALRKDIVAEKVDAFKKKIEGMTEFAVVQYEDHDEFNAEMEHEIMPDHPANLYRHSEH